jgi:hypothetical protein
MTTTMDEPARPHRAADPDAIELARQLLRLPPRVATHVLVGPALVYDHETEEAVACIIVRGIPGGDHRSVTVDLGRFTPDPLDDPFTAAFDTVLQLRRAGDITMRQARTLRAAFIAELTRAGLRVEDCASEEELVDRYARVFPGERARRLCAAFAAENAAGEAA